MLHLQVIFPSLDEKVLICIPEIPSFIRNSNLHLETQHFIKKGANAVI
jgi:hypothetical protein